MAVEDAGREWANANVAAYHDELTLIRGVAIGDPDALRAFFFRFQPLLLDQARRLHVSLDCREEIVVSFLDDMALSLMTDTLPRSLTGYLVRAFRNAVLLERRHDQLQSALQADRSDSVTGLVTLTSCCSSYAIQSAAGPDVESDVAAPVSHALNRLADYLMSQIKPDDRALLLWRAHGITLREIATWLDVSAGALRTRASRLSSRLTRLAIMYYSSCDPGEARALEPFFRRTGLTVDRQGSPHPGDATDKCTPACTLAPHTVDIRSCEMHPTMSR